MWSDDVFSSKSFTASCQKITQYIENLRNPAPAAENPVYSQPNTVFNFENVGVYPHDLEKVINGKEKISYGWIQQLQSFWVATFDKLFIFHYKLNPCFSTAIKDRVVAVSFISDIFVVLHENSISLFDQNLQPMKATYTIPHNVTITCAYNSVVGCSDGYIREIILNPAKTNVTLKGSAGKNRDDISSIVETDKYYVSLSVNSTISIFNHSNLSLIHSFKLKNIISIWHSDENIINAFDKSIVLYKIDLKSPKYPTVEAPCQVLPSAFTSKALWNSGFLTTVDPNAAFDQLTTIRFQPTPAYTTTAQFGIVHQIAPLPSGVLAMTSAGIIFIHFSSTLNTEDEALWELAVALLPMWDTSISEACKYRDFVTQLQQIDCDQSKYALHILEDANLLSSTQLNIDFPNKLIRCYFTDEKDLSFSRLRKIAFSVRLTMAEQDPSAANSKIVDLIRKSDCGDTTAEHLAITAIEKSSESGEVPTEFPILADFLYRYRLFDLMIDCLCRWANYLYPDALALNFENENFPTNSVDDTASFQLRLLVMRRLNPLIKMALRNDEAFESVMKAVSKHGVTFQYYLASYLDEELDEEQAVKFDFPELIQHFSRRHSLHLPRLLIKRGQILEAFLEFIKLATDDKENFDVSKRIEYIQRAIDLNPDSGDIEKAKKLLISAEILKDYIDNNKSLKRNFFAEEPAKLVQTLKDYNELQLAVLISSALGVPRKEIVDEFCKNTDCKTLADVLNTTKKVGCSAISEKTIAQSYFNQHGKFDCAKEMVESGVSPLIVFTLVSELSNAAELLANNPETLDAMISLWPVIEPKDRAMVTSVLSKVIVIVDAKGDEENAEMIREMLPACTLEEQFTDVWDRV